MPPLAGGGVPGRKLGASRAFPILHRWNWHVLLVTEPHTDVHKRRFPQPRFSRRFKVITESTPSQGHCDVKTQQWLHVHCELGMAETGGQERNQLAGTLTYWSTK